MNLINRENGITEPYQPGVYMLTGINGIGKSTLVDAIAVDHPEIKPVHASQELRGLFGNVSREELELLTPEEKLSRMVIHFTTIFDRSTNDDQAVMMDTHLVVPIRKEDSLVYEDIWSSEYTPHVSSMAILSAEPASVRQWRLEDEITTGRKRSTDVQAIAEDQDVNISRFEQLLSEGQLPAGSNIVINHSGRINEAREAVESVFRYR